MHLNDWRFKLCSLKFNIVVAVFMLIVSLFRKYCAGVLGSPSDFLWRYDKNLRLKFSDQLFDDAANRAEKFDLNFNLWWEIDGQSDEPTESSSTSSF